MNNYDQDMEQGLRDRERQQEIQRAVAANTREHHVEIENYQRGIKELQDKLSSLISVVQRLETGSFQFGHIVQVNNKPDANNFRNGDEVFVVDPASPHSGAAGKIVGFDPVVEDGKVQVEINTGIVEKFHIGTEAPAQIRLTHKGDGTNCVVNVDGKLWEVRGAPELNVQKGDFVKVHEKSRQIVGYGDESIRTGNLALVEAITEYGVEVQEKGEKRVVLNPKGIELKEGDRVFVDTANVCILRKVPKDARHRYKLTTYTPVKWDDVGGLLDAKKLCRRAIEDPFKYPELFIHYKKKRTAGILMYGPPGNGKTLLARAMATGLAEIHDKESAETGYIYVKSPEILDKWVGNSEAEIRNLFERGRNHYREHKYPALLVFDEFDAIAPQRGSRRSSDISDTLVPMFLGEMQGVDDQQTAENPIVVVMTNQANVLDPAITRPGRMTYHIKVNRPSPDDASQILDIHTKGMPFVSDRDRFMALAVTCQEMFSKTRLLYRINNEHDFTFGDCISGAMIEAICETAKENALDRDIAEQTMTGVTLEDMRKAVQKTYEAQKGINHSFDLSDFAEKVGIQAKDMKVDRCFSN